MHFDRGAEPAKSEHRGLGLGHSVFRGPLDIVLRRPGVWSRAAEAFVMRHLEGLTNGEVAEVLGTSAPVVAVTLHRARRSLQKHLTIALGNTNTGSHSSSLIGERS